MNVKLEFAGQMTVSDPQRHPTLIVGRHANINAVGYDRFKIKFGDYVTREVV